mmetsp:Transcript_19598/g.45586  ORF Transcript_19598/g.45586 Transcript_19598/m.45586 type:complete len:205 (-) Transcript_19598:2925-3539(-)
MLCALKECLFTVAANHSMASLCICQDVAKSRPCQQNAVSDWYGQIPITLGQDPEQPVEGHHDKAKGQWRNEVHKENWDNEIPREGEGCQTPHKPEEVHRQEVHTDTIHDPSNWSLVVEEVNRRSRQPVHDLPVQMNGHIHGPLDIEEVLQQQSEGLKDPPCARRSKVRPNAGALLHWNTRSLVIGQCCCELSKGQVDQENAPCR